MKSLVVTGISFYQATLRYLLPRVCRFYPSCSEYSKEALKKYSLWIGLWISLKRLLKCHPFHPGGWDPIEEKK